MQQRSRRRRCVGWLTAGLGGLALWQGGCAVLYGAEPTTPFAVAVAAQDAKKPPEPRPVIGAAPGGPRSPNRGNPRDESFLVIRIKTTAPEPGELFRLESEQDLRQRMRQETRQYWPNFRGQLFPELTARPDAGPMVPRLSTPLCETVEPYFVCYGRTYFEQTNFERYGWNFGLFQPALSAGLFYTDLVRLPFDWIAEPHRHYDCNSGYCLPGDPVPLTWNPFISK